MTTGTGPTLGRGRATLLIAALVCGAFGIGVSEFLVMGLLPQIAADLLPDLIRTDRDAALAATGTLSTAYAAGVVVGMVTTPILLRRVGERRAIVLCALSMLLWTLLTALAPTLAVAVVLRFLAALTHATYVGLGAVVTARILGAGYQGRGNALVHGGLAAANLVGVPALTAIGAIADWRVVFGACLVLFALPVLAVLRIRFPSPEPAQARKDAAGRHTGARPLILVLAITLLTGAGFSIITYVAPLTAHATADVGPSVAASMLVFGIGMNVANLGSGWLADRSAERTLWLAGAGGLAAALLLALVPAGPAAVLSSSAAVFCTGIVLGGVSPAAQLQFMTELPHLPRLAASLASGSANLGSVVGTAVGAGLLAAFGPGAIPLGSLALLAAGFALLAVRAAMARRTPPTAIR